MTIPEENLTAMVEFLTEQSETSGDHFMQAAAMLRTQQARIAELEALEDSQLLDDLEQVAREYMTGFSVVYKSRCDDEPGGFVAMRRRYRTEPAPTLREAARRLLDGGDA